MFAVTGATGQLGRLVLDALLQRVGADRIVALARDPVKLADQAARGITVRRFDYDAPETLAPALADVEGLLLISSNDIGKREAQHRGVIDAARGTGVGFLAYTSILHADTNPLDLAIEHRTTEAVLKESGLAHALLRNGWYNENYTAGASAAIAHGVLLGSSGEGRISTASRADYAEAAAVVLTGAVAGATTYELAGDAAFTLAELAAVLAEEGGVPVAYRDLPQEAYAQALESVGLPAPVAAMLADSSAKAADDVLFDDSRTLGGLIGRPTTPIRETVKQALRS